MKTQSFLTAVVILFILCRTNASPENEQKLAAANNIFAFKLLRQITYDQPAANVFISPYSVSSALQMVANGAAGRTRAEMQKVLATDMGATGLSGADLNQAGMEMARSLHDQDTRTILEIANAMWYRQDAQINPAFIACNHDFFGATVAPLNFADPRSVAIINHWASKKTHGHITEIANGMIDPVNERLFLANAVYFKGKWTDPFDPGGTHNRPFYLPDGSQEFVPMMSKSKTFMYLHGADYQAVRLPYEGENLAMYVFLPDTNSTPEKLLRIMNGDVWRRIIKPGFGDEDGDLVLPKFKLKYGVELVQPLKELGIKKAFVSDANFSGISAEPLYIFSIVQKTFVEVTEEGTEAAAVTGVSPLPGGIAEAPPKRFEMVVDHPFLFLIEDDHTGTILFMGIVYDPPTS